MTQLYSSTKAPIKEVKREAETQPVPSEIKMSKSFFLNSYSSIFSLFHLSNKFLFLLFSFLFIFFFNLKPRVFYSHIGLGNTCIFSFHPFYSH